MQNNRSEFDYLLLGALTGVQDAWFRDRPESELYQVLADAWTDTTESDRGAFYLSSRQGGLRRAAVVGHWGDESYVSRLIDCAPEPGAVQTFHRTETPHGQSTLVIPLRGLERSEGELGYVCVTRDREYPADLAERLQPLSSMSANILNTLRERRDHRALGQQLNTLVESASDGILLVDAQGFVRQSNRAAGDLLRRDNPVGHPLHALLPLPDGADRLWGSRFGPSRTQWCLEVPGSESARVFELNVARVKDCFPLQHVVVLRDVTQRESHRRELQERERRLAYALSGAKDGVWDWDLTDNTMQMSAQLTGMLGYDAEHAESTVLWLHSLVHPADRALLERRLEAHLSGKNRQFRAQFRMTHRNGDERWILCRGMVTERGGSGRPLRMVGTHVDITDAKHLERRLREARDSAEAASHAKAKFLATMSHEIRTPMNGVIGMASLLAKSELSDGQYEYVDIIRKSGENLLSLIDDILDFSRLEAGRLDVRTESGRVMDVVTDVVELLAPQAESKGLYLVLDALPDVPERMDLDPARLRQVLVNLVGNALKFTSHGGISLRASTGNGVLSIAVEDTGIGIAHKDLTRLFRTFEQLDGSVARRFGGSGLGLSISRGLARLMGGDIGVESQLGTGSTFTLTLPIKHARSPRESRLSLDGVQCVVALDHPVEAELLGRWLQRYGAHVTQVARQGLGEVSLKDTWLFVEHPTDAPLGPIPHGRGGGRPEHRFLIVSAACTGCADLAADDDVTDVFRRPLLRPAKLVSRLRLPGRRGHSRRRPAVPRKSLTGRVLIVEDNPVNLQVLHAMVAARGLDIEHARDGFEALAQLEDKSFDLVLMDLMMPGMDGLTATRRLRAIERETGDAPVPVVAVTANALDGDRQKCFDAGMNDYLPKPVRRRVVDLMLEKWLDPRQQAIRDGRTESRLHQDTGT